jgi:hypothetical protein
MLKIYVAPHTSHWTMIAQEHTFRAYFAFADVYRVICGTFVTEKRVALEASFVEVAIQTEPLSRSARTTRQQERDMIFA